VRPLPQRIAEPLARTVLRYGWKTKNVTRGAFVADGLASRHNHDFLADPAFVRAYERGVQAAGWDYNIPWRVHTSLWAAHASRHVEGDFVELGTGRGMTASCILDSLPWSEMDKTFWLYDTFSPLAVDSRGEQVEGAAASRYYAVDADTTASNFAEWPRVVLVPGRIPDTFDRGPEAVAFLHIDLNHPAPEVAGLEHFWPRLSDGALVLLDDYAYVGHAPQHAAMNAAAERLERSILTLPTGQGLLKK
jgi:hypothetical protein